MRIIDLFSGAGGLTFGFYYCKKNNAFVRNRRNSFVFANEFDPHAAMAFSTNYPDITMLNKDIKSLGADFIKEMIGNDPVDLIIGGPPCQSFSTVGQRIYDEKATLYEEYLRMLNIVRPKMFLFENVKGILSMKEVFYAHDADGNILYEIKENKNRTSLKPRKKPIIEGYGELIMDKIHKMFSNIDNTEFGYNIVHKTLNAIDYGVPENRERVFIIGIRKDLDIKWCFPEPKRTPPLTIYEAISDLPELQEGEDIHEYNNPPVNEYQRLMRQNSTHLTHHYCGIYGEKIRMVIENVNQGEGKNDFNALVDAGIIDEKYRLTSGYANTYGRLVANQPSPTITNNMTTPSALRCIHYAQNRALSPREGARIQSFPDWFEFYGKKAQVTKQIGNAVPPVMAIEIAKQIEKVLNGVEKNG